MIGCSVCAIPVYVVLPLVFAVGENSCELMVAWCGVISLRGSAFLMSFVLFVRGCVTCVMSSFSVLVRLLCVCVTVLFVCVVSVVWCVCVGVGVL